MSNIRQEIMRFIVAGISAVTTDLLTYYLLLNYLDANIAKSISFLLGTVVAYIINKYWTFEKKEKSYYEIVRFSILYGFTLGINVLTNKLVLDYTAIVLLAFLVATGASTVLNFLGQKYWVFK